MWLVSVLKTGSVSELRVTGVLIEEERQGEPRKPSELPRSLCEQKGGTGVVGGGWFLLG